MTVAVVLAFVFTEWPRELVALTAAGVLLVSRRLASRDMIGLVDWHLLVLFIGLFVVNRAIAESGFVDALLIIVGSIANIIVVDQAVRRGVVIDWRRHAIVGVPVTLPTLALAAGWLAFRGW